MTFIERFTEWLRLYVLITVAVLAVTTLGVFLYTTWAKNSFFKVLSVVLLVEAIILIGIGIASLLPLSEYSYVGYGRGRSGVNPVIIREGLEHIKRGTHEPRELGMLLGIVGLTLLLIYLVVFL